MTNGNAADLVLENARVFTADADSPFAEAIAIRDGVVVAVGSAVAAVIGESTERRDLGGAFVMPGIVDAHSHFHLEGQRVLHELPVPRDGSMDDVLAIIDEYAKSRPDADEWVIAAVYGSQVYTELTSVQALARLDAVSHGHPVMVRESSRHNRWVNSRALELMGVNADTPDPEHGEFVRDAETGALTGVLVESAGIVAEHVAAIGRSFDLSHYADRASEGIRIMNGYGVTATHDAGTSEQIMAALADLDGKDGLDAWVVTSSLLGERIFGFLPQGEEIVPRAKNYLTAHHRPTFVKIFVDGIPPTYTGSFLRPYANGQLVEPVMGGDVLYDALRYAAEHGLSGKMHCTGDGAVNAALNAIERLRAEGFTDTLYQVGHSQFISEGDVPRFQQLGAIVEISPYMWFPNAIADMIDGLVHEGLSARMHPNRDLIDAGAIVAVGSDWPAGANLNPWHAVHGLVNRTDPSGSRPDTVAPDQAVTLAEALTMVTLNGAKALGIAEETGSLQVGKSADFIIVDRDPFEIDAEELHELYTTETWFAGRKVYDREESDA